ncbi:hypothetical protein B9479_003944 [Cryptococcus floricola]|uniref:Kinesin motor domain-containing protein n=1 Tax=Cryptococcus floricola TaxID=2591691 RepID=A0A5D3AZ62_9TREE|nr:hypothetical protein B9479_003944 [Cryptococcus floricola]
MSGNNIKVVCRFRPMNRMETEAKSDRCVEISDDRTVSLKNSASLAGPEKDGFTFDRVFDTDSHQRDIFGWSVKGIVDDVMSGFNGTLFCYGQTGSGKTYTMMGADIENENTKGLIPRIVEQIFASIIDADSIVEYTVKVSYMDIYMEKIKDLLAPQNDNLSIHEDKVRGVYVKSLTDVYVSSEDDVYRVMQAGSANRVVSATNMNAESSRSHSIFVVGIHQRNTETGSQKTGNLYLVDLAGSEKIGKTGATGQTLEEAKKINKSLSALGMVINSLTDGKSQHVPYRDSKLTRILQESLGGNSRTTLIINCSPATFNEPETLGTLRFGMRAKSIKNKARVNVEMSPAELRAKLKRTTAELAAVRGFASELEEEVKVWRSGGQVEQSKWTGPLAAASDAASGAAAKRGVTSPPPPTPGSSSAASGSRAGTPGGGLLAVDGSRPDTPTSFGASLDKDEREEFLKRENELSDQLAEKESALAAQERLLADLKDEIAFLKEAESGMSEENKTMSGELNELRISSARLESESKDATITLDSYKEKIAELQKDIEDQKAQIEDLKHAQTREKEEEKEKRKHEMLSDMMSKIDMGGAVLDSSSEKLRGVLRDLEEAPEGEMREKLSAQTRELIRSTLAENHDAVRGLQERLRLSHEEGELQGKRRSELEKVLNKRDAAYEELLDKTASGQGISLGELKSQLESKYTSSEELLRSEITSLTEHAESRASDVKRLQSTVESYKLSNEELNRALSAATAGTDGENFANSAKELERARKAHEIQYAEFDIVKKSLMKDLQNRCEKVVELEMQLDEVREQYKIIARSANSRAQQKKLEFLEHNLDALSGVQKQLVEQNTILKKEVAEAQRKLMSRNDRIQNLEAALSNADQRLTQKNQKYEQQLQLFREKLAEAQSKQNATYAHGRIAKPLRGGGGAGAGGALQSIMGGGKQEESPGGKRQSWFFSPQQR